jgi:hypothetical protein
LIVFVIALVQEVLIARVYDLLLETVAKAGNVAGMIACADDFDRLVVPSKMV